MSADDADDSGRPSGLPLDRAVELLAPEAWLEYQSKYMPVAFLGNPESIRAFEAGKLAQSRAQGALLDLVRGGRIELRTLHPHASPEAKWTGLSPDISEALTANDVNLESSTVQSPDGHTWPVRAFVPSELASAGAPIQSRGSGGDAEPKKNKPAKVRIAETFDSLPESQRALVDQRGGIRTLEGILKLALGDVPPPTLQREFRRLRNERAASAKRD